MTGLDLLESPKFVLSLRRRQDKRDALREHLDEMKLPHLAYEDLTVVDGVDKPSPPHDRWRGSFEGHLAMLEAFLETGKPFALLLEDDVGFHVDAVEVLDAAVISAWGVPIGLLYLGYSPSEKWTIADRFSDWLVRLRFATCTHAYYVWERSARAIVELGRLYLEKTTKPEAYDFWLARHFCLFGAYATDPIIAYQRDGGVSDNTGSRLGERRWR